MEVLLFDVLPVVSLWTGEPEQALLEDGIVPVPQRQRQAEVLTRIADSSQPVLVPTVCLAAGVIVGEPLPGVSVGAVVLPHGAPCPVAQVGAPLSPVGLASLLLAEPELLGGRVFWLRHRWLPVITQPRNAPATPCLLDLVNRH